MFKENRSKQYKLKCYNEDSNVYVWVTYLIKCDAFLCHVQCASTNCFAVELGVHTMCTYVDPEEKYSD